MKRSGLSTQKTAWLITIGVITGLVLLALTLRLIIVSDPSMETDVNAYLTGAAPIVVLHERPDNTSGVSTLMERGIRVTVDVFDPGRNPFWVYVRRGDEGGWVQLEHLSEQPP
ncbi:MAG: hypothetical protein U9N80_13825 [Chloroflexota bacterium]|nr:hypothetical protein [Chloroflexota bacterium]